MRKRASHKVWTAAVCVLLALGHARLGAAQEAWLEQGVVGLGLTLRQLDGEKRVLLIGAHPDDEDNGLLATLERAHGVRAAYLSLSRGEGGQNVIGLELSAGLGVLRSGELLSARRVDGAEQFFSRAYDFGFSKSAEEALRLWPRDSILSDVVWVVRTFRPHVIVSMFGGTPRDGHGQHQMAGIMAREAFEAAGDRTRFPEHLQWGARPWRPLKLYRRSGGFGFGFGDPGADGITVESGHFDPLLGQSYFQLAMASRSRHRSQDIGSIQPAGPRQSRMTLWSSQVTTEATDTSLFAGVDTTLVGLTSDLPAATRRSALDHVERYRAAIRSASADLGAFRPADVAPRLAEALAEARALLELASAAGEAGAELAHV
ncbi:MAG: PIG-L family deacetylase, partial [Gemmatimonadetes bacterium]|nr:PIG-L family deacetylase [Gemmatimonadota bacterium]